jgi:hypothetical protein
LFKLDPGALRKGSETVAKDGREMNKNVIIVLGRNEAEPLRIVEPLDGAPHVAFR